jgi:type I restriction enzyme, S subunit
MHSKTKPTAAKEEATPALVPKMRFPEFRDGEAWHFTPLDSVCEILNNRRRPITGNDRTPGPYPYYGASGIVDYVGGFIFDERLLLVGEDGAKWGAFEKTAFIAEGKYWVNNHAHVLKPFAANDTLLENYLTMQDLSPFVTGAAPPKLTLGKLRGIPIPLPPKPAEQQKIAECLSSVDELIAAQARKLDALKTHKKGLMQQLFPREGETQPRLRFPEFKNAGEWEMKVLGDVVKSFKTGKLDANAMVENGQYRFYTCAKNHYQIDNYAFEGEALLVAGNGAHLGYIHHYIGKFNAYQRTYVLQKFEANVVFLRCLLDRYLPSRIQFEKKDGNTPYIVLSTLTEMPLVIPKDAAEQQRIADCLTRLDDLIAAQTQTLEALKTHKQGLMQQLFPSPEAAA